jgi:hypothetical protein
MFYHSGQLGPRGGAFSSAQICDVVPAWLNLSEFWRYAVESG